MVKIWTPAMWPILPPCDMDFKVRQNIVFSPWHLHIHLWDKMCHKTSPSVVHSLVGGVGVLVSGLKFNFNFGLRWGSSLSWTLSTHLYSWHGWVGGLGWVAPSISKVWGIFIFAFFPSLAKWMVSDYLRCNFFSLSFAPSRPRRRAQSALSCDSSFLSAVQLVWLPKTALTLSVCIFP